MIAELHAVGEIGPEHVHAAMQWRADWLDWTAATTEPVAARAAADRLRIVREGIGRSAEMRLVMLLVRHMSLETIVGRLSPDAQPATAVDRTRRLTIEIMNRITPAGGPAELTA